MRKALVIARREYAAMVGAKAFVISVALMPVLMLGGAFVPQLLRNQVDVAPKYIVVLDASHALYQPLEQLTTLHNTAAIRDPKTGKQIAPKYELEKGPDSPIDDNLRMALSDRVRKGELYAFVEIPAKILKMPATGQSAPIVFYAENTALSDVKQWFDQTLTQIVQSKRLQQSGIDPAVVTGAQEVPLEGRGLFEKDSAGRIKKAEPTQVLLSLFLPMGIMMFMFMIIMMAAQPMLQTVLEEKTNRIAEVLLGSATPLQIMTGKLLGNVAGSLTVAVIYLAGGYALASYNDIVDVLPMELLPWLLVYLLLAILMFSSLFMAIGASVNELKEAQSLLLPVMMLVMVPLFVWLNIVREPNSSFATWLSLIPPFVPMLMCLRMAATDSIPLWQPVVGLILMLITTWLAVFASSRIFRIGMLSQGQTPKLRDMVRWAFSGG